MIKNRFPWSLKNSCLMPMAIRALNYLVHTPLINLENNVSINRPTDTLPSTVEEWTACLLRSRKALGWNLWDSEWYPGRILPQIPTHKCQNCTSSQNKTASFHILSKLLFTVILPRNVLRCDMPNGSSKENFLQYIPPKPWHVSKTLHGITPPEAFSIKAWANRAVNKHTNKK